MLTFEKKHEKLAKTNVFAWRLVQNATVGFIIMAISLAIGMLGYSYYENMTWIDAYENASMILSGMGPVHELKTNAGKIFAGTYALFSGIIFLVFMAIIFAPIFHRFFHEFHLKDDKN